MSQTAYNLYQNAGFKGMLADMIDKEVMSYSAEAAVGFGAAVQLGTNKERQVVVATAAANAIGIAVAAHTVEQSSAGVAQYAQYDTVPVMKYGRIWVETDDAVVAGTVANLKISSGKFTDEAVTTGIEAFTQFSARFITGTTAAGLAIVEIK